MNIIFGNEPLRLTVDAGFMLFGLLAAFFYAMSLGRKRLILTLLSIYCSVVVFRAVPSDFFALSTPLFSLIFSLGGPFSVTAPLFFFLFPCKGHGKERKNTPQKHIRAQKNSPYKLWQLILRWHHGQACR